MPRSDQRRAALGFCLRSVAALACLFLWISLLTFSPADAPNDTVWPNADPPRNACGAVGARLAFYAMSWFGVGAYPLLLLLSAALLAGLRREPLPDLWLRFVGAALVTTATSAAGALFLGPTDRFTLHGAGGGLGASCAAFFLAHFQFAGTVIVLVLALVVGLILAADQFLIRLARVLGWAAPRSARVIARGSSVITGVATGGYERLAARLSPAAAGAPAVLDGPPADDDSSVPSAEASPPRHTPAAAAAELPRALPAPAILHLEAAPPSAGPAASLEIERRAAPAPDVERRPAPALDLERRAVPAPPVADLVVRDERCVVPPGASGGPQAPPAPSTRASADEPLAAASVVRPEVRAAPRSASRVADDAYELPPLDLLDVARRADRRSIETRCREKALILEQTLNEFRLDVRVVAIETGPVITVFELKLAPGIKVSQIVSLSNDIARALRAPAVRVVAPLAGKNTIGIEVPNLDKEKVRLRDLLALAASPPRHAGLPLFLGKDAAGQPVVSDLTRMPHLLIAGTTGSGKSVCITSIIMSILLTKKPHETNLILIDPKVVELSTFKDIPHLICPIVTEISRAEGILDWAATKMDERYALLAEAGVKDIAGYNQLGPARLRERFQPTTDDEWAQIPKLLPYVVIVIDELADLMMTSAKQVEFFLCRLAQKSRAVGIHLIVSTQRPQANVVTGLIKSNLPCRIAFRVASRLDSRIVLDQNGGEVLLGQGDLLFLPPGTSKLIRAQGTYVSDDELRAVVRHCCAQQQPRFNPELIRLPSTTDSAALTQRDELFDQAADIVVQSGRGSVSLLQRRLTIGYGRASRLIDQMYAAGIVGEYKGSQAREVIITPDEWAQIKAARDREEQAELAPEA